MSRRFGALTSVMVINVMVAACASVRPWEREAHARRYMQVDADSATSALDQHVYEYREGSTGAYNAQSGSGCGCN